MTRRWANRVPVPTFADERRVRRGRTGRPCRRARAACLAASDPCWICGHPGSQTADHVVPLALGGELLDPANLAPAHGVQGCPTCGRKCNSARGDGRPQQTALFPVSRRW
jgi:5-methylcytosine-specific restriction endonuclease McrA